MGGVVGGSRRREERRKQEEKGHYGGSRERWHVQFGDAAVKKGGEAVGKRMSKMRCGA